MCYKNRELTVQPAANTTQLQAQNNPNKWIVNLSSTPLPQAQESLLSKRPNYAVAPNPHLQYITSLELAYQELHHQEADELRADINRVLRSTHPPKPNLAKEETKALVQLRKDSNRIILTAHKGVAMVVMDRKDYIGNATNFLSQPVYRTIDRDPTNKLKAKLITLPWKIQRNSGLENHIYKNMYPMGCTSPKLYGLPKIHKANTPSGP